MNFNINKKQLNKFGFSIVENIFSDEEINRIISCIEHTKKEGDSFLKTKDVFAIRQLLNEIPQLKKLIFTTKFKALIHNLSDSTYFLTKAIYFDKPIKSNWFVAYHQDLSISVTEKIKIENYKNWTNKNGQIGVIPPISILENTITLRIHLDNTTKENGALKVISKTHLNGIIRKETTKLDLENETFCELKKGGVMLMKPLTMHASNRTTNLKRRRVIHLEFSNQDLIKPLNWLEKSCF